MRTVLNLLKYELKLVKKQIEEDNEIVHSNSDSYPIKYIRKRNRNNEKYRDELIREIELLKLRKQQFENIDFLDLPEI